MLTAVATIIIFLVMISLHEFGHFIASKLVGVRVLEFAIGMGPAILKWKGRETQYSLRIFPVGGYCSLEGEDEKNDDERAFCNQSLWKRFLVLASGAVLNIILGFAIIVGLTANEKIITTPVVDGFVEDGYAQAAGVMPGDRIIRINGKSIGFYQDLAAQLNKLDGKEIEVVVKRDGKKYNFTFLPTKEIKDIYYEENGVRIVSQINDAAPIDIVYPYSDIEGAREYIGKTEHSERYIIGFVPRTQKATFLNNIVYSYHYTGFVVKMVYQGLIDLVTGNAGFEQVSGPVGIVSAVNTMVNSGSRWVQNVLFLAALLTINLGVFNLLPLPALDGGRILFLIIELIRRKPLPPEKEGMVHAAGLIILLAFAVIISFKDIWMLIK